MTGKLLSAVRESLREMHHLRQSGQPRADWLARNALERALLRADAANPAHERRQLDERVLQAMDYVGRHFDQPVQVAMIARAVGLSASRLSHLFGEQTGQSPVAYLEATRLRHARELLEYSARPVSAIAEACGFSSAFYFSTRFRRHFGLSPSAFRQSLRSGRAD
jgi:AraC family transcriptional regulator of arabinose operon